MSIEIEKNNSETAAEKEDVRAIYAKWLGLSASIASAFLTMF